MIQVGTSRAIRVGPMHKLMAFLHADDAATFERGRKALEAVIKKAGGVAQAARELDVPRRSLVRWIAKANLATEDGRTSKVSTEAMREAFEKYGLLGAAEKLNVHHTTIWRRLGLKKTARKRAK